METTEDTLLGGQVILLQPAKGYRVAIDPVLLAACVPAQEGSKVLDLGSGTGAASFCLQARVPGCKITGIENNQDYLALSQQSLELNHWQPHIAFLEGRVEAPPEELESEGFDWAMANPPFFETENYSASPNAGKSAAHAMEGGILPWIDCAARFLKPEGWFFMIYPAGAEEEMLAELSRLFRDIRILRIQPKAEAESSRLIIASRKTGLPSFREAGSLILHEYNGEYTPSVRTVLWEAAPLMII